MYLASGPLRDEGIKNKTARFALPPAPTPNPTPLAVDLARLLEANSLFCKDDIISV